MASKVRLKDFLGPVGKIDLKMELVAGRPGTDKIVKVGDINRPGLTLAGFYDFFAYDRIQIFGLGESAFMRSLSGEARSATYEKFFSYDLLCCIFTHNEIPDQLFLKYAEDKNIPVYKTEFGTTRFVSMLVHIMDDVFAPVVTMHSTLVDVFGVGVLLMGKSGVGKSECALELVERSHRLVADDMVSIKKMGESLLMGSGSPILKHNMEIRGMGIINVQEIFGIRSVRNKKRIELVVLLEEWDNTKEYDRLGLDDLTYEILDVHIPYMIVPVRPGRNIPVIIETAALNQRLKKHGVFSARELDKSIQEWMKSEKKD